MTNKIYGSSANRASAFTLVEIMIVVLIIGILLAIAVPNFLQARESARAKACIGNLKEIDTAKQQYMIDNKLGTFNTAGTYTIAPAATSPGTLALYLRTTPKCPESGTYNVGNESQLPVCLNAAGTAVTGYSTTGTSTPHQLT